MPKSEPYDSWSVLRAAAQVVEFAQVVNADGDVGHNWAIGTCECKLTNLLEQAEEFVS
jgi:hypothetical protein